MTNSQFPKPIRQSPPIGQYQSPPNPGNTQHPHRPVFGAHPPVMPTNPDNAHSTGIGGSRRAGDKNWWDRTIDRLAQYSTIGGCLTATIIGGLSLIVACAGLYFVVNPPTQNTVVATQTAQAPTLTIRALNVTTTPSATATRGASTGSGWTPLLQEATPYCQNPAGTSWAITPGDTATQTACSAGFQMEQNWCNLVAAQIAEVDLQSVNNAAYSQVTFQAQVRATFESSTSTPTWAYLIFQTPRDGIGGFALGFSSAGDWVLQHSDGSSSNTYPGRGHIGASQMALFQVTVQNGMVTGSVNGTAFPATPADSGQNTVLGLGIYAPNDCKSDVVGFDSLELDTSGGA